MAEGVKCGVNYSLFLEFNCRFIIPKANKQLVVVAIKLLK